MSDKLSFILVQAVNQSNHEPEQVRFMVP